MKNYEKHNIKMIEISTQDNKDFLKLFGTHLLANIKARFPSRQLIKALNILNLEHLLTKEKDDQLIDYGINDLRIILDQFSVYRLYKINEETDDYYPGLVEGDRVHREFSLFKFMIFHNHKMDTKFRSKSQYGQWAFVFELYGELYAEFFKLIRLVMVLPVSTVSCERLFSLKNLMKTRTRNKLRTNTLDVLLRCSLAPDLEWKEYEQDILKHFVNGRERFVTKYKDKAIDSKTLFDSFVIHIWTQVI
jgi:hypothetical protein